MKKRTQAYLAEGALPTDTREVAILAKAAGISRGTIHRARAGKNITLKVLFSLAQGLGKHPCELLAKPDCVHRTTSG